MVATHGVGYFNAFVPPEQISLERGPVHQAARLFGRRNLNIGRGRRFRL